jgi:hypothetical protein
MLLGLACAPMIAAYVIYVVAIVQAILSLA